MTLRLVLAGMARGKARFLCALAGIAAATGAVVFTTSLGATNAAQAPLLAARAAAPWSAWTVDEAKARVASPGADLTLETVALTVDYRPGGRVLQGPPMRALLAPAPSENPYAALALAEGRWPDDKSDAPEVVCVRQAFRRFRDAPPPLGDTLKFVGRNGTMTAEIVGFLDGELPLPPQFPTALANDAAFRAVASEKHGLLSLYATLPPASGKRALLTPSSPEVCSRFRGDEQRRMDYARPLMLIAAVLTALSLLANSLLLSVEANRDTLSRLRMAGLTRGGVVRFVMAEAFASGTAGWLAGAAAGIGGLALFVALSPASFPAGAVADWRSLAATLAALPLVIAPAALFALHPALAVRAIDAQSQKPRKTRRGMAVTFALGFAAFVAVEVWGSSLMRAFVPSPEWPDAIVSLLPAGVSAFEVEKLRDIEGVKRISELLPLQVRLEDGGDAKSNALFLAAEWLPHFRFVEGTREEAVAALQDGGVVITEMMSRALSLHRGDTLLGLPIAGVVDLNWHMVTSRGLVRGLNRMPNTTLGPVFASFDTVESLDRRPAPMVRMTHLWVEYEPEFLSRHGAFGAGRIVEAEIARRLGNPPEAAVRLHARDEIADGTLAHGNDVIGAAARVPFAFLFILSIGFVAMLVAEADARRRELKMLRTIGATRLQLAALLTRSAVATALLGMAAGLPLGAAAGYFATFKTASIWPGLPHYFVVPWRLVAEGACGAVAFALAFAIPAALALTRTGRRR